MRSVTRCIRVSVVLGALTASALIANVSQAQFGIFGGGNGGGNGGGMFGGGATIEGGGFDWGGLVEQGINAIGNMIQEGQHNNGWEDGHNPWNNGHHHHHHYNDNNGYYDDYYVRPTQPAPPPKPVAKVKKNKLPPEKAKVAKENPIKRTKKLPKPQFGLTAGQIKSTETERLEGLETQLSAAIASNPELGEKLEELKNRVATGGTLTDADIADMNSLMTAANLDPAQINSVNQQLGEVKAFGEVRTGLVSLGGGGLGGGGNGGFPGNGGGPGTLPSGVTVVIYNPNLPQGEVFVLPDGALMVGTGGLGEMAIAEGQASEVLGMAIGMGEPVPSNEADMATRCKSGLLLFNPEENGASIQCVCNDQEYMLKPGHTKAFPNGESWAIEFDRGGRYGRQKYTLKPGTYRFGSSNCGWELYSKTYTLTIDNSQNSETFQYTVDNAYAKVAPGATKTHTCKYPILVRFDRGEGTAEEQKRVKDRESTLVVAVNPNDGLWDLFPAENFESAATDVDFSTFEAGSSALDDAAGEAGAFIGR